MEPIETPTVPAARFDPFADDQDIPYDTIAALREEQPIAHLESGFFYAFRHDDVAMAMRDGGEHVNVFAHEEKMRAFGVKVPEEERLIPEIEGPRHTRLRSLLMSALHPRLVNRAEEFASDVASECMDSIVDRGGGELVREYAVPIPARVFAHVLGLPEEDHQRFRDWSDEVVNGPYPKYNRTERGEGLKGGHPEFADYIDALAAARRTEPGDDLVTRMVQAKIDGRGFTETELRVAIAHLIMAGNETTTHLIGNVLWQLLLQPETFARVRADRSLVPKAIEESLRRDPPVAIQPRTVRCPVELRGRALADGDRIVLGVAAANRDPAVFREPDAFIADREEAGLHVSFGAGPHFCPGAALARLEARAAVNRFMDRVVSARIDPDTDVHKVRMFWANGPESLPVTIMEVA